MVSLENKEESLKKDIQGEVRKEDALQEEIERYQLELKALNQDKVNYERFIELFDELSREIDATELATSDNDYKLFNAPVFLNWRYRLFELSLIIQERYILKNSIAISNNLSDFLDDEGKSIRPYYRSSSKYNQEEETDLRAIWEVFRLCFPVITTTLHSFSRSNFHMIDKLFDYILVDEAGQILPYYLVAPLYRGRRAVIVGDEKQLEPIRDNNNNVFNKYEDVLSPVLNVNTNTAQGFGVLAADFFEEDNSSGRYVKDGILLDEHRRCQKSIAQFSNKYIYGNKMSIVDDDKQTRYIGRNLSFVDIRGINAYNSNESEVKAIKCIVEELVKDYKANEIAVIAPYSNQVKRLKEVIGNDSVGIGTVHSFQGKDKKAVVFSTVIDSAEDAKAKRFIGAKPNMLNVAFTRAKEQLIVVGNYSVTQECEDSNYLSKVGDCINEYGVVLSIYDSSKLEKMSNEEKQAYFSIINKMSGDGIRKDDIFEPYLNEVGMIEDNNHYPMLLNLFQSAKNSIEVISPWISKSVLNDEFINSIKEFKKANKRYSIVFGYNNLKCNLDSDDDIEKVVKRDNAFPVNNEEEVQRIKTLRKILGNDLVHRPPLHTKVLIVDRKHLCIGSHNWLAKKGQQKNAREEMSVVVRDQGMIDYICKKHKLKE